MRKTELTKEQQKKFKWLMDANTVNEDVKVSEFGYLIWKGGTWKDGNLGQRNLGKWNLERWNLGKWSLERWVNVV